MSGPMQVVLIVAVVGYVLARRLRGEPAEAKRMLVLPAVMTLIGLSHVSGVRSPLSAALLVGAVGISVVLGLLRGLSVRVEERDGLAFVRYTWATVALWAANLAIRFGYGAVLHAVVPKEAGAVTDGLLLSLGVGMAVEGVVVLGRALRGDTRVMWAAGKNGRPHRTSPLLDDLGQRITGRTAGGEAAGEATRYDRPGRRSRYASRGSDLRGPRSRPEEHRR